MDCVELRSFGDASQPALLEAELDALLWALQVPEDDGPLDVDALALRLRDADPDSVPQGLRQGAGGVVRPTSCSVWESQDHFIIIIIFVSRKFRFFKQNRQTFGELQCTSVFSS